MSMYQVCIREVDKKSNRITPESGELTASPDPRPSHLYIPSSRQADPRTKPRTNPYFNQPKASYLEKVTTYQPHIPKTAASYPEKVTTYQPLLSPTRGIGDLEGVPDTRSGGSVLKAPQRRRGGTPPRALSGMPSQTTHPRNPYSPASVVWSPSLSNPYRVTGTLENSRTVPSGSPERTSASPMRIASAPAPA